MAHVLSGGSDRKREHMLKTVFCDATQPHVRTTRAERAENVDCSRNWPAEIVFLRMSRSMSNVRARKQGAYSPKARATSTPRSVIVERVTGGGVLAAVAQPRSTHSRC